MSQPQRVTLAALAGLLFVGCARQGVAPTPQLAAVPDSAALDVTDSSETVVPPGGTPLGLPPDTAEAEADQAADDAALQALQELEFKSLAKGAEHVRGMLPAPSASFLDEMRSAGSHGGAASHPGPTYDIDVESFADHDRVQYYVNYFLGPARHRFTIWLERLPRYEGMIRDEFRALGVPEDMVYLGLIESGYSNTAVSRSNAVGMWQFMRSTARLYGLTVNTWVDERRDPFKATDAAGRYLKDLNDVFGSWYLAAAAYNGGEGRISRGLRRLNYDADSLSDNAFFDLSKRRYLRRETRDYVPKLIAAAMIAKEPARYGFDGVDPTGPLAFDEITVPDATGLDVIARLADTTARAMVELNPQYIRGVTPPRLRSVIRVPRGAGPAVAQRYADLPPTERVNFAEHIVRSGETLSGISQRYGVSVRLIQAANGNVAPRRLRVGRRLIIPVSTAARTNAVHGRVPSPVKGVPGVRYHTVRAGETLWKLARQFGVTIGDLRRWNGIYGERVLKVGQKLRVGGE